MTGVVKLQGIIASLFMPSRNLINHEVYKTLFKEIEFNNQCCKYCKTITLLYTVAILHVYIQLSCNIYSAATDERSSLKQPPVYDSINSSYK
jgi:hypothetical protein